MRSSVVTDNSHPRGDMKATRSPIPSGLLTAYCLLSTAYCLLPAAYSQDFERIVIDPNFPGAYQVEVADVNGDKKPDIIAVGGSTCAWYENPTWKKRIVTGSRQTPGIISSATADLDGDGKAEIAIAYEFGMNAPTKGKLLLAVQGGGLDDPWNWCLSRISAAFTGFAGATSTATRPRPGRRADLRPHGQAAGLCRSIPDRSFSPIRLARKQAQVRADHVAAGDSCHRGDRRLQGRALLDPDGR